MDLNESGQFIVGTDQTKSSERRSGKGGNLKVTPNPFRTSVSRRDLGCFSDAPGFNGILDALLAAGNALLVGRTRDGNAISITLLVGDERHRTYCTDQIELDEAIRAIGEVT